MRVERAKSVATKDQLIRTAERLFALEGIDAVSLRRIAAESGQKNGSVLQYHFGSRDALIDAIVEQRMAPLNARRRELLDRLGESPSVTQLVTALVLPFAEQLLDGDHGVYYVRLMGELFARGEAKRALAAPKPWNEAFFRTIERLRLALPDLPSDRLHTRLFFMAGQMVQATSAAELELRGTSGTDRRARVRAFAESLIDYVSGALVATSVADVDALLRAAPEAS